jgi:dihydrofolate reductase
MGRKTWEALPKPLEGRRNIVMTHDTRLTVEGGETVNDIEQALAICEDAEEIMVIGGGEIYRLWLPRADRILLSRIDAELEGDTTFPPLDPVEWHCISIETHMPKEGDDYPWTLLEMVRHYEGL